MYSTFQACKLLNIKPETLNDWLRKKFITETTRINHRKKFSDEDFYKIDLFRNLIQIGLKRKFASEILANLKNSQYEKIQKLNNQTIQITIKIQGE